MAVLDAPGRADTARASRHRLLLVAHLLAAAVVVVGVATQVFRPLAPDLGPPPDPSRWFDQAHLARASAYRTPLYGVALAVVALRLAVPLLAAFTAQGRRAVNRIVDRVGEHRPARAATAVILAVVITADLVTLPLVFWATYIHEGVWGFRTQGLAGWTYDRVVVTVPVWLGVAVIALGGYWLAGHLPRAWPAVGGSLAGLLAAGVVLVSPVVLEPLLFDTEPLPPGPMRAAVEQVLTNADEPVEAIVVADASRRTTKRNAYVSGLGATRRVVLYDTLVHNQPPEEVAMVLAHEVGHHQHRDIPRGVLLGAAGLVVVAYVLAWLTGRWTAAGRQASPADPRAAAAVLAVVVLMVAVSQPAQSWVSRRAEAAADLASLDLTTDSGTFLRMQEGLARANLGGPVPPTWAYLLWSSHPPTAARMGMAERWPLDWSRR